MKLNDFITLYRKASCLLHKERGKQSKVKNKTKAVII
jgi:hypothetical protein